MSATTERAATEAAPGETAACEAVIEFYGVPLGPCGQPSAGLYRRICVHEHVKDGRLCQEHAGRQEAGLCRTCFDLGGGLSHECSINVTKVGA